MKTINYLAIPLFAWNALYRVLVLSVMIFLAWPFYTSGQDIESIGSNLRNWKKTSLDLGGGINLNSSFYNSNSINPRRDPFTWSVMANLNLNLLGINAPFSFVYSDGNDRFSLPSYSFTGISPTYKWATLHAGDRSMYFNRYTLSNLNFRGGGLELTPGKWTIKTMFGRLRKANAEDLTARQSIDPAYERLGGGGLVSYAGKTYNVTGTLFKAWDRENSIISPVNSDILPAENVVLSLSGRKSFGKGFTADLDLARSAYNSDKRSLEETSELSGIKYSLLGLFNPTENSSFGNAYNIGLTYTHARFSLRLGTEKIDRNFQSLGSLFFNNDLRHYTASFNTSVFKNKITLGVRGGLEQTNISDNLKPKNERVVAAVNLGFQASNRLNISGNYSNFDNTTKIRAKEDPTAFVDSLFLAQTTQSAGLASTYRMGDKSNPSSLSFSFNHQNAKTIMDNRVLENANSTFDNFNLRYSKRIKSADLMINAGINYNISKFTAVETTTFAPSLSVNKSFFNRQLRSSFRSSYSILNSDINPTAQVLTLGLNGSWAVLKNQRIALQLNYLKRMGGGGNVLPFNELYGSLRYAYQFSQSITGKKNK